MAIGLAENVILYCHRTNLVLPDDTPTRIADTSLVQAGVPHLVTEDTRRRAFDLTGSIGQNAQTDPGPRTEGRCRDDPGTAPANG